MNQTLPGKLVLFIIAASAIVSSCSKSSSKSTTTTTAVMVSTFAGSSSQGTANGTGAAASFNNPSALAYSSSGELYVGDWGNSLIRSINLSTAAVSLYAGTGVEGLLNGQAASAEFNGPANIAIDNQGDIFVADEENNVIREITKAGIVTTVAGSGAPGYQDGPAAAAMFWHPEGLVVDANGNIYVCDGPNNVIRKVTVSTGMVSTYAGTGVAGFNNGPLTSATFYNPFGLTLDGSGNIFVADNQNNCIRKIDVSTGQVSTFAGSGAQGFNNGPAADATFYNPLACVFDSEGNLYIADFDNNAIRKISTSGIVSTYAGNGTQGSANGADSVATFNHPIGLAVDGSGNVYVADERNNLIRKIGTSQN
jgi:streptogramin lyase